MRPWTRTARPTEPAVRRRWRGLRYAFFLSVFALPAAAIAAQGGLFVLHSMRNASVDPALLKPAYIDGIACQIAWADVEPREGQYDWSKIDEAVDLARRDGKRVTIHLMPLRPPEWVYQSGVKSYTREIVNPVDRQFGQVVREYVPWDATFLRRWTTLTQRFGERFSRNTTVFAVSVTAPLPEMQIPGSFPPRTPAAATVRALYDRKAYLEAWRQMIDVYQQAFPDKPKFLAPGVVLDDAYFADEVMAYAKERFGEKLWAFNAQLRAVVPSRFPAMIHIHELLARYGKDGRLGFQMIWSASQDRRNQLGGTLRDALQNGISLGAKYIEVYEVDVTNPELQADLADAARKLHGD